jgi:outer membrane protein
MRFKETKILLLVSGLIFLNSFDLKAQKIYEITVKDAMDIAFKNVNELKNARLDYLSAEARNQEITSLAYPQINGSFSGNHYLALPQIQFPDGTEKTVYDVLRDEGVKDGSGNTITEEGELTFRNFSFFTPWNINGSINVQQLLFEPQVFVGLQARKTLLESSELQLKVTEDKVREQVYKSYYAVLITEKALGFVQESIIRLEKLSREMNEMYKNGFVEKLDIDKTKVNLTNTKTTERQLKNGIVIGYAALKMTLGLSQTDSLILKDVLTTERLKEGILTDTFKYEDRNEVKLLNTAIKLQGYDIRRYKLSYAPTLGAFYNLQRTGQRQAGDNGSSKPWFWYNTSLVGLSVNLPIFDGFQKKNKIKQTEFNQNKTINTLDQLKKGIDMELTTSRTNLSNAILTMDAQEQNMQLAENVFSTVKKKYEQGVGSSFELLQADTDLQQAQSNYFNALYNAILAKINYFKALGRLDQ